MPLSFKRWTLGLTGAAAGVGLMVGLYAALIERVQVRLDRFTVTVAKPGLPAQGLIILHLSDFHFRSGGRVQARKIAELQRLLAGERYDIVALTGDLIHDAAGLPTALALIGGLRPRLGAFSVPGNHDYAEYSVWGIFGNTWRENGASGRSALVGVIGAARKLGDFVRKVLRNELVRLPVAFNDVPATQRALVELGVYPVVNRAVQLVADGVDVWIAGVDDPTEGKPDLAAALGDVPNGAPLILLAHNPDIWLAAGVAQADLILSGHTHGGQIRLPLVGAAHTQGTHLTRQKAAGWFARGAARMFVTRGLGESIPLRLGAPPQVALIRWVPAR